MIMNDKMIMRIKRFLIGMSAVFLLSACGSSDAKGDITAEDLRAGSGDYMLRDVSWGSEEDSVRDALNFGIEEEAYMSSEELSIYRTSETLTVMDYPASAEIEFQNGGLTAITFQFSAEDQESVYQEIAGKLEEVYGEPETIENENTIAGIPTTSKLSLWKNEGESTTVLQLTNAAVGEQKILSLALGLN